VFHGRIGRPSLSDDRAGKRGELSTADRPSVDVPSAVLQFAPKKMRPVDQDEMDAAGGAIIARLKEAGGELRAAEDRLKQPEGEIKQVQGRAVRAEAWLQVIRQEIEEKLIAPTAAHPPKPVT